MPYAHPLMPHEISDPRILATIEEMETEHELTLQETFDEQEKKHNEELEECKRDLGNEEDKVLERDRDLELAKAIIEALLEKLPGDKSPVAKEARTFLFRHP